MKSRFKFQLSVVLVLSCTFQFPLAHARYYDAAVGRFITPDSIVPSAGDPQSLNRYAYVRNNPIIYDDPSGHKFNLKNIGWAFLMPYAPSLSYNGLQGNIKNSNDFKHYGSQAVAWNAGIAMAAVGIAAITPGTAVNAFAQSVFPGTWDAQAMVYFEQADAVIASIGTNGYSILGWGSVSYGGYTISYNLQEESHSPSIENQNSNQTLLLAMSLTYNDTSGSLVVIDETGKEIATFSAGNNAVNKSRGKWPEGEYEFSHFNPHPGNANSSYGSHGNFVFDVPGCSGCGVHSGRENVRDPRGRTGPQYGTNGCIRTTDSATKFIKERHQGSDPLIKLRVIK